MEDGAVGCLDVQVVGVSVELPAQFVDEVVVGTAQQDQVRDVGRAVVADYFVDVMDFAPAGRTVTTRPSTPAVAFDENQILAVAGETGCRPEIECQRRAFGDESARILSPITGALVTVSARRTCRRAVLIASLRSRQRAMPASMSHHRYATLRRTLRRERSGRTRLRTR